VNLNQTDASGSHGRTRYLNYLSMMAERFPDCGFVPMGYPYHGTENSGDLTAEIVDIYYEITFPQMLSVIRQFNEHPVIFNPISMGFGPWWELDYSKIQQTWFYTQDIPDYSDANLLYNINTHDSYNSIAVANMERWDYDVEKLRWHYQPCFDQPLPYVAIEFLALNIHFEEGAERPIDQSRLDWVEENMKIIRELGASWFYFRYENPSLGHSPLEKDGSDSALVPLLKQYALFGDVNNDGKVDMKDIGLVASAFGSYPDHPRWDPIVDINGDGKVNVKDIGMAAMQFGKAV
jgi:hypothetical protein